MLNKLVDPGLKLIAVKSSKIMSETEESLEARLTLLGRDVAFMGERVHKVIQNKYLPKLTGNRDVKKYCMKVAQVLEGVIKNSVCYARDLNDIISKSALSEDLADVTDLLKSVVAIDEKLIHVKDEQVEECVRNEIDKTPTQRKKCDLVQENRESTDLRSITQESVHLEADSVKSESNNADYDSQATQPVNKHKSNSDDLSNESKEAIKSENEDNLFDNCDPNDTVQAPSPLRNKKITKSTSQTKCSSKSDEKGIGPNSPRRRSRVFWRPRLNSDSDEFEDGTFKEMCCGKRKKDEEKKKTLDKDEEQAKDETNRERDSISDSQATCLDSQDIAELLQKDQIDDVTLNRRDSTESFIFHLSDEEDSICSGTKKQKESDHISEFETPSPSNHGSDHNIEAQHSNEERNKIEARDENPKPINTSTKPVKLEKEKVIRKTLLKVIDEFYKKRRTQSRKKEKTTTSKHEIDDQTPSDDNNSKNNESQTSEHNLVEDDDMEVDLGRTTIPETPPPTNEPPEKMEDENVVGLDVNMEFEMDKDKSPSEIVDSIPSPTNEPYKELEDENIDVNMESGIDKDENLSKVVERNEEKNVDEGKSQDENNAPENPPETLEKDVERTIEEKTPAEERILTKNNVPENDESPIEDFGPEGDRTGTKDLEEALERSPVELEHAYQKKVLNKRSKANLESKVIKSTTAESNEEENDNGNRTNEANCDKEPSNNDKEGDMLEEDVTSITNKENLNETLENHENEEVLNIEDNASVVENNETKKPSDLKDDVVNEKMLLTEDEAPEITTIDSSDIEENIVGSGNISSDDASLDIASEAVVETLEDHELVPIEEDAFDREEHHDLPREAELENETTSDTVIDKNVANSDSKLNEHVMESQNVDFEELLTNEEPILTENESLDIASETIVISGEGDSEEESIERLVEDLRSWTSTNFEVKEEMDEVDEKKHEDIKIDKDVVTSEFESSGEEEQNKKESENDADSEGSEIVPPRKKIMRLPSTEDESQSIGRNVVSKKRNSNQKDSDGSDENDGFDLIRQDLALTQENEPNSTEDENLTVPCKHRNLVCEEVPSNQEDEDRATQEDALKDTGDMEVNPQGDTAVSSSSTEEYSLKDFPLSDDVTLGEEDVTEAEKGRDSNVVEFDSVVSKKRRLSELSDSEDGAAKNARMDVEGDEESDENFKLDDRERDELLDLLDEHFRSIKDGLLEESDETKTSKDVATRECSEVNRDALMQLLQEYEEAVAAGRDLDLEEERTSEESEEDENSEKDPPTTDVHETENEDIVEDNLNRDGDMRTPEPLLEVVKEEEFVQSTPGKKGRKKTELQEATEIYKKLLEENDTMDSSSTTSLSSTPTKTLDSDISDVENSTKKSKFKVSRQLLNEFGIDKELTVKVTKTDIGDSDFRKLPKTIREKFNIDRLCDLTTILQQRKREQSASDCDTPTRKKRGKKRPSSSGSTPTSPLLSSDDQSSDDDGASRHSRSPRASPLHFHSDDSQEAMAKAFLDRMEGDSSDDDSANRSAGEESTESDGNVKRNKKLSRGVASDSGSDMDGERERVESKDGEEQGEGKSGDEKGTKPSKPLTAEEKRKKRWKRDPLLHGRMLSSDGSSDSDCASAGSEASVRRRQRLDKLKSEYDVKTTDSDTKKPDSDAKPDSDTDSDRTMCSQAEKGIQARKLRLQKKYEAHESDSSGSSVEFVSTKMRTPPRARRPKKDSSDTDTDDDILEGESPSKGKGRRNIRALMSEEALTMDTKKANEEEKKRIKRLEERKTQRETFSQSQSFTSQDEEADALVLDIDKNTLEPLIKVHPKISRRLKPHQREGIQFMWDSCYESCDQMKKGWKGSGCILAHCMGLGKTLQVLGLVHTLFAYSDVTKTKYVLVVCPLSTVSNWRNEYKLAYKSVDDCAINIFTIEDKKTNDRKFDIVKRWRKRGGILVMGYEAFGNMSNESKLEKWEKQRLTSKDDLLEALLDPGPDLVVCDEGHLLKNKQTNRNISLNKIKTRRRIVLTGTPLQNNLIEYYCMVNFVKPNLLGNEKEYKTNFVNPITNGQYEDSNMHDIKLMKCRTHVLHRVLKGTVQRVEDTELKKYLPKLVDYALFVQMSEMQVDFYNTYLDLASLGLEYNKDGNLSQKNFLADVVMVKYICSHPYLLSVVDKKGKKTVKEEDVIDGPDDDQVHSIVSANRWWRPMLPENASENLELGHKVMLALAIVEEAEALGEKVLIFSTSLGEMDVLEHFLSTKGTKACPRWQKRQDYYRMDGTIIPEERAIMCDKFNDPKNKKLRVFIISTKVGGLGLNLTAANRIIIMAVSWNPSYDIQSVFRAYRFGQEKAVFVYRLISMQTMEEKIYQRQVTKLAIAHRVVDKHQIKRAYSKADIEEMYGVRPEKNTERAVPNYPDNDELLAKLLQKFKCINRWHEHQGLLANRPEEDLNDQEKEAAWEEFNRKQVEPPLIGPFGPGMMPNMGAIAAMGLMNTMGNMNPAELMNLINFNPNRYADDHSYSLPKTTNTTLPSTSAIQPSTSTTPNNYQPRALFNSNNKFPTGTNAANFVPNSTMGQTINSVVKMNQNNMTSINKNNFTNNQLNNMVNMRAVPMSSTASGTHGVTNSVGSGVKNWLTQQVPSISRDRPFRFSLAQNPKNIEGLESMTWTGVEIKNSGGMLHFSYKPPHMTSLPMAPWIVHSVIAPDGNLIKVYTFSTEPSSTKAVPRTLPGGTVITSSIPRTLPGGTTITSSVPRTLPGGTVITSSVPTTTARQAGYKVPISKLPTMVPYRPVLPSNSLREDTSVIAVPSSVHSVVPSVPMGTGSCSSSSTGVVPAQDANSRSKMMVVAHMIKDTETGRQFVPVRMSRAVLAQGTKKVVPPASVAASSSTPKGLRVVPSSTLTGKTGTTTTTTPLREEPHPGLGITGGMTSTTTPLRVAPHPGLGISGGTGSKQVVPNPFYKGGILNKNNAVPVLQKVTGGGFRVAKNNVKAAGLTGSKNVVPNPASSKVKFATNPNGLSSPKPSVAPPPAHSGKNVSSPTVAKPPRLTSFPTIDSLSPRNPVDLSAGTSFNTKKTSPSPSIIQNVLRSPPANQNFNSNLKTAISNNSANLKNSPSNNHNLRSSPRNGANSRLGNSPKSGSSSNTPSSTHPKVSDSSKHGTTPVGAGKRNYETVRNEGASGSGNKSPVPAKKIIISQTEPPNYNIPTALPALTPRPTVAPMVNLSPKDLYKEMLRNLQGSEGGGGLGSAGNKGTRSKLQTKQSRATLSATPTTSQQPPTTGSSSSSSSSISNKENRKNRLQLTRPSAPMDSDDVIEVPSGGGESFNQRTLEKLKEKGVSLNKVDKNDTDIIDLD